MMGLSSNTRRKNYSQDGPPGGGEGGHGVSDVAITEDQRARAWAFIIERLVPLLMPVLIAVVFFIWGSLSNHEGRLIKIESSRFTREMGKEISDKVVALELKVSQLEFRDPPRWFVERVDKIETHLLRVDESIDRLRDEVKRPKGGP